jgi:hypothetical protein
VFGYRAGFACRPLSESPRFVGRRAPASEWVLHGTLRAPCMRHLEDTSLETIATSRMTAVPAAVRMTAVPSAVRLMSQKGQKYLMVSSCARPCCVVGMKGGSFPRRSGAI